MRDLELTKMLLAYHADPNAHNRTGQSALMIAAVGARLYSSFGTRANRLRSGQIDYVHQDMVEIARLLLDSGADPLARDANGRTAIDYAGSAWAEIVEARKLSKEK
jgi:ankyrin repeat protein